MTFIIYAQLTPVRKTFMPNVHVCSNEVAARGAGHTVIVHPRGKKYEEVIMPETPTRETHVGRVSVRNHTADELGVIRGVLSRLPTVVSDRFSEQYTGIVCVNWSGQNWSGAGRPGSSTLLSGGANMDQPRTRDGITESGRRIELTHSAMYEPRARPYERRGVFTLWHELGHVAYNNRLTPRTVGRADYGESIHPGPSEQPAYAFMWYFLDRFRLTPADGAAFDDLFGGASPAPATPAGPAIGATDPLANRIHQSVGQGGMNAIPDVRVVQKLLNRHTGSLMTPLTVTGACNALTIDRIRWFQQTRMGIRRPDGRVDPGGQTLRALSE